MLGGEACPPPLSLPLLTNLIQIITKLSLELFLPNVFQNGFSSTKKATLREEPEPPKRSQSPAKRVLSIMLRLAQALQKSWLHRYLNFVHIPPSNQTHT